MSRPVYIVLMYIKRNLHVHASSRFFLIWQQNGEGVEKALCVVTDVFQDHVRVTNCL